MWAASGTDVTGVLRAADRRRSRGTMDDFFISSKICTAQEIEWHPGPSRKGSESGVAGRRIGLATVMARVRAAPAERVSQS
jgi:hypothetical protein